MKSNGTNNYTNSHLPTLGEYLAHKSLQTPRSTDQKPLFKPSSLPVTIKKELKKFII